MAFFQFRKGREEPTAPPAPAQTVQAMRRRALHRLVGAAVLVLAAVIGFPLVFDNQPRPIPVDLPIVIPDKNKMPPLVIPPAVPQAAGVASAAAAAPVVASVPAAPPKPIPVTVPVAPSAPVAVAPAAPASTAKASVPASAPAISKASDASKAQALLEGKDIAPQAAVSEERFVVQVGAFAEPDKVREVRHKVESAGLKTYTQVVETKDGSRTRVRVGPFADKAEAIRVADKIRKLDLPAAILTL